MRNKRFVFGLGTVLLKYFSKCQLLWNTLQTSVVFSAR